MPPSSISESRSPEERRRYPRVPIDCPVTITIPDGNVQARLRDISRAGLCFFVDRRIPEMTVLDMQFELGSEEIRGRGVVVRCQPISQHIDHFEVAVFLNDLSNTQRARLDAFVASNG